MLLFQQYRVGLWGWQKGTVSHFPGVVIMRYMGPATNWVLWSITTRTNCNRHVIRNQREIFYGDCFSSLPFSFFSGLHTDNQRELAQASVLRGHLLCIFCSKYHSHFPGASSGPAEEVGTGGDPVSTVSLHGRHNIVVTDTLGSNFASAPYRICDLSQASYFPKFSVFTFL